MLRRLRRLVRLSSSDRWMLARAYARIALVELRLRSSGFAPFLTAAPAGGSARTPTVDDVHLALRYAAWIQLASRFHPVRARCLHRSLALHTWLLHDGLSSRLRIGVRKEGEALKAHAWVELDGQIVNDSPFAVAPFTPLNGLESIGRLWNDSKTRTRPAVGLVWE